jgi:hypothetical protein
MYVSLGDVMIEVDIVRDVKGLTYTPTELFNTRMMHEYGIDMYCNEYMLAFKNAVREELSTIKRMYNLQPKIAFSLADTPLTNPTKEEIQLANAARKSPPLSECYDGICPVKDYIIPTDYEVLGDA